MEYIVSSMSAEGVVSQHLDLIRLATLCELGQFTVLFDAL